MSFWEDIERELGRMRRIFRDIESELEGIFRGLARPYVRRIEERIEYARPFADIREEADKVIATIDMAGIPKENIDLTLTEREMEVKGHFREEDVRLRRFKGYYYKTTLPAEIKPEEAKAAYRNGVLQVTMPKAVPVPKGYRVKIE